MNRTDRIIKKYAEENRPKKDPSLYAYIDPNSCYNEPMTNFVELQPLTKINILDTIIEKSKSVFGPYGGLYGEIEADTMVGQNRVKEGHYIKSKDGHNFFKSLSFSSKYSQTVMTAVQQLTKYIAGYEGDTSRDGTTSLSIVGCNVAKELLALRLGKPEIPSTIHNIVFDIVRSVGTSAIEKCALPVYDADKAEYLNGGFEKIINAINTTVDKNPIYASAFGDLMNKCVSNHYDVLNAMAGVPNYRHGAPRINIEFKAGVKFRGESLNSNVAGGFKEYKTMTFVLDGLITAPNRDVFVLAFQKWVRDLISTNLTDDGKSRFGKYGDLEAPLFIITKKPPYLESIYQNMTLNGIQVKYANGESEIIKPRFMLAIETEMFEVFFNDIRSVFPEMFIDLKKINSYISAKKTTKEDMLPSGVRAHAKQTEVDISSCFPRKSTGSNEFTISIPYTIEPEDIDMPENVEQVAKFDQLEEVSFSVDKAMFESNWDGMSISLAPYDNELIHRTREYREKIQKLADSYGDTAMESNELVQRLEFFSGVTLKPTIYFRGEDEGKQMFDLYEDALGVFVSVHKFGVMPGANLFILKAEEEIYDRVMDAFSEELDKRNVAEVKRKKYIEFADDLMRAVANGYKNSLHVLSPDDADRIITDIATTYNLERGDGSIIDSFDIVTGQWTDTVVEAAKTTAEVFAGAVSIAKDMLELRTIRVLGNGSEYNEAMDRNKEMYLHPKYKNIKLEEE